MPSKVQDITHSEKTWICPSSLSHKQLNWFNKTCVALLNVSLSECVSNISVKWYWFLYCISANTLSYCYCTCSWWRPWMSRWYDKLVCLGFGTFPICWLWHWPNTGSADPEQIADTRLHILLKCREQGALSNMLRRMKCSHVYNNCPQRRFTTFRSVTTLKAKSAHDPSSQVGYVLSFKLKMKQSSDCFIWIISGCKEVNLFSILWENKNYSILLHLGTGLFWLKC